LLLERRQFNTLSNPSLEESEFSLSKCFSFLEEVLWFLSSGSFSFGTLDFLLNLLFLWSFLIEFHELGEIELRFLEYLDLLDHDILERENLSAFLLDLLSNGLLNEFLAQLLEGRLLCLSDHDFHHLLANSLLLRSLGIAGSLHLFVCSPGEPNAKHSQHVSI